jgi:hypothetical protein
MKAKLFIRIQSKYESVIDLLSIQGMEKSTMGINEDHYCVQFLIEGREHAWAVLYHDKDTRDADYTAIIKAMHQDGRT